MTDRSLRRSRLKGSWIAPASHKSTASRNDPSPAAAKRVRNELRRWCRTRSLIRQAIDPATRTVVGLGYSIQRPGWLRLLPARATKCRTAMWPLRYLLRGSTCAAMSALLAAAWAASLDSAYLLS